MPVTPTYPGVYIQELASDVRTIVPVETATAAFIGRALRGPVNKPVTVFSYGEFEQIFGGLWLESQLAYAVSDFFLNGGAKAIIVRAFRAATKNQAWVAGQAQAKLPLVDVTAKRTEVINKQNAVNAARETLRRAAPNELVAAQTRLTEDEQALAIVQKDLDTAATGDATASFTKMFNLAAADEGEWGSRLAVQVTRETDPRVRAALEKQYAPLSANAFFNVRIRDTRTGVEEYYPNVSLVASPRRLDRVLAAQSALVRVTSLGDATENLVPRSFPKPQSGNWWEVSTSFKALADGSDGAPLEATDITGEPTSAADADVKRGLRALDDADIFNLLCIPPYAGADVDSAVLAAAATYCEQRRAILIVDPPAKWTSWSVAGESFPIPGLSPSANAAVFFPRIKKANPLRDNQVEEFAPCGAVAGVIARTDFRRGVWKAPAGLEATLRGVVGFSVPVDDNANGQLNPLGINCLRVMPAAGPVVWGARTSEGDDRLASQWKYLPVRRMALWIEETLYRSTHWAVFEPNDEPLWSSLRLNIGNFMGGLFRQGAFQGRTPAEAYFVRCDASTTPQSDIDRGIVNVVVGFAPLKPAEFVVISIKQITNQGAPA